MDMGNHWNEDTTSIEDMCVNRFRPDDKFNLLSIDVLDSDSELQYFPMTQGRWMVVGTLEHIESNNKHTDVVGISEHIRLTYSYEELTEYLYKELIAALLNKVEAKKRLFERMTNVDTRTKI